MYSAQLNSARSPSSSSTAQLVPASPLSPPSGAAVVSLPSPSDAVVSSSLPQAAAISVSAKRAANSRNRLDFGVDFIVCVSPPRSGVPSGSDVILSEIQAMTQAPSVSPPLTRSVKSDSNTKQCRCDEHDHRYGVDQGRDTLADQAEDENGQRGPAGPGDELGDDDVVERKCEGKECATGNAGHDQRQCDGGTPATEMRRGRARPPRVESPYPPVGPARRSIRS